MNVFYSVDNLPRFREPVVTVGSFDGVHQGHRVLLDRVKEIARRKEGETIVATFFPHPRQVLARGGDIKLLNTLPEKIFLLEEAGIENLVVLPFDQGFASLSSEEFVADILVGKIGMKHFVVGFDHRFGHEQAGDSLALREMGVRYGFEVKEVPRHDADNRKVSSSLIRGLISQGNISGARELLTRPYPLLADIHSDNRVTIAESSKLLPPMGDYEVVVNHGPSTHNNTLNIDSEGNMHLTKDLLMKECLNDAMIMFT